MPNITNITPPRVELIDPNTGYVSREWYRWFYNLYYATGGTTNGAIPADRGGTGTTTVPNDGQILVGVGANGSYNVTDLGVNPGIVKTTGPGTLSLDLALTPGDGVDITPGLTDLTVSNTGVLSIIAGDGIEIDQSTGDVTISVTGGAVDQENQTATSNQTVFTLTTMTYVPGSNTLSVFIDGINQQLGTAFTETSSTVVTFSSGLHVGAKVRFATA